MAIFWDAVVPDGSSGFSSSYFMYTGTTTPITRAEMSKEIMKKVAPETTFRKYVSKVTDFGQNKANYLIIPKRNTGYTDTLWTQNLSEFQALPTQNMSWHTIDISVNERGMQIPFTQRAKIFTNFDIITEVREQVADSMVASVEHDLLMNAFGYIDVLGLNTTSGLQVMTQSTVLPSATFATNTANYSVTNVSTTSTTFAPISMTTILSFAQALENLYTPSYNGQGYGQYLILLNRQAQNELMQDPVFYNAVTRFQDRERLYAGYIGTFYGQEFVLDKGKWIDKYFLPTAGLTGKAVAIFLAKDSIKEAIVMPEQVLPMETADFGRFMSIGIDTYRGEMPIWFSVEGQPAGGILITA